MAENFLNLEKDMDTQVHEAWRTKSKINSKKSTLKHIIIKLLKVKD